MNATALLNEMWVCNVWHSKQRTLDVGSVCNQCGSSPVSKWDSTRYRYLMLNIDASISDMVNSYVGGVNLSLTAPHKVEVYGHECFIMCTTSLVQW